MPWKGGLKVTIILGISLLPPQVSGDNTSDLSERQKKDTENVQIDRNK
jgi:hypothetical protein